MNKKIDVSFTSMGHGYRIEVDGRKFGDIHIVECQNATRDHYSAWFGYCTKIGGEPHPAWGVRMWDKTQAELEQVITRVVEENIRTHW